MNEGKKKVDEIALQELCGLLWRGKGIILIITLISIIASATYFFITKPIYEADVFIAPPILSDIMPLNIGRSDLKSSLLRPLVVSEIYALFIKHLLSSSIKHEFFDKVYFPAMSKEKKNQSRNLLYRRYLNSVIVKKDSEANSEKYLISAKTTNALVSHDWISQYIALANEKTKLEIKSTVSNENKLLANYYYLLINIKKEVAKKNREDRLLHLKEGLSIARAGGIKYPLYTAIDPKNLNSKSSVYLFGSIVLEKEIQNLLDRKNNDPFIKNLRLLQEKYYFYNNIKLPMQNVNVFRLDGDISLPDTSISPTISTILMLGLIGGLILGGFVALILTNLDEK